VCGPRPDPLENLTVLPIDSLPGLNGRRGREEEREGEGTGKDLRMSEVHWESFAVPCPFLWSRWRPWSFCFFFKLFCVNFQSCVCGRQAGSTPQFGALDRYVTLWCSRAFLKGFALYCGLFANVGCWSVKSTEMDVGRGRAPLEWSWAPGNFRNWCSCQCNSGIFQWLHERLKFKIHHI